MAASTFLSLSALSYYSDGVQPSVAINDSGTLIEVHKSQSGSDLYYQVATVTNGKLTTLGSSHKLSNPGSNDADTGYQPNCALNNSGIIVEVHQAQNSPGDIWTHIGVVKQDAVIWGKSQKTECTGVSPSVALTADGWVILVYENTAGSLKTALGKVDSSTSSITWQNSLPINSWQGTNPVVAVNANLQVALAYLYNGVVCCSAATITPGLIPVINWPANNQTLIPSSTEGVNLKSPGVALADDGTVLYIMEDGSTQSHDIFQHEYTAKLRFANGLVENTPNPQQLQPPTLHINGSTVVGVGCKPIIGLSNNGQNLIAVAESPDVSEGINPQHLNFCLGYTVTTPANPINWMSAFSTRSLSELIVPGAHDAGMYTVCTDCRHMPDGFGPSDTQTQTYSFKQMLDHGVRYFDVRPVWWNDTLYTGHFQVGAGCCGATMQAVFDGVSDFITQSGNTQHEVIILKFSHYYNRDADSSSLPDVNFLIDETIQMLQSRLSPYLYGNTTPQRIADISLDTLTTKTEKGTEVAEKICRVLAVFDQLPAVAHDPANGIYSYSDWANPQQVTGDLVVYDKYSNTNKINHMITDQLAKFNTPANHTGDLFLLSWTLTPDFGDEIFTITSVKTLAAEANPTLLPALLLQWQLDNLSMTNLPNILYVDFVDTFAITTAYTLNGYLRA